MDQPLHAVIETLGYIDDAQRLFGDTERMAIVDFLSRNPTAGDLMPGTGGARKLRWAMPGRGKSGGARVVTYFGGIDIPVFLLAAFGKNEKSNLDMAERNALKKDLAELAATYRDGVKRYVQSGRKNPSWR
ncbi:MAG: type II toxin-antitoxin system RelE/ParE family toxin [Tagaea sp.]|nr:type II toxin-antitoxin system RelE/ParE family toxin [Tagaea sp.]